MPVTAALLASLAAACSFAPSPAFPRPALEVPPQVAARYALPGTPELAGELRPVASGIVSGELSCGPERIRFHLHRAQGHRRPFVLLVPILAGGESLMQVLANRMTDRGFHAAWCERVAAAVSPPQRGAELEQLFRRTVVHQRALLAWLRQSAGLEPESTFAFGISMGGIVASVLAAVEPELGGVAICLAGADLPSIVLDSSESKLESWRNWRQEVDGIGDTSLAQELRRHLQSDPALLGAFVPTERVLMVGTTLDTVVRPQHQQLLWEALGRPRRLNLPLGHYTAALALDPVITSVAEFFGERRAVTHLAGAPARSARPAGAAGLLP